MIVVGVDLGKRSHAVCFVGGDGREVAPPLRVAHTGGGLRRLQTRLAALPGPQQVVMEASGPHWLLLERRLRAAVASNSQVDDDTMTGNRHVGKPPGIAAVDVPRCVPTRGAHGGGGHTVHTEVHDTVDQTDIFQDQPFDGWQKHLRAHGRPLEWPGVAHHGH